MNTANECSSDSSHCSRTSTYNRTSIESISFNAEFPNDANNQEIVLKKILKELTYLQIFKQEKTELEQIKTDYQHEVLPNNYIPTYDNNPIKLNKVQKMYRLLVKLNCLVTDVLVTPHRNTHKIQTMGNIFLLNIIKFTSFAKRAFSNLVNTFQENTFFVNIYLRFYDTSANAHYIFIAVMTSLIMSVISFWSSLMFLMFGTLVLIFFIPLIVLIITAILLVNLLIYMVQMLVDRIQYNINIRHILVYFADKIPPSVGGVDALEKKQNIKPK